MAWETRKAGGRYYTRSRRVGGRVRREYVPLSIASIVAQMDEEERLEREERAMERRREREAMEDAARNLFAPLDALDALCRVKVAEALSAAGYYEHKREWRRRGHAHQATA